METSIDCNRSIGFESRGPLKLFNFPSSFFLALYWTCLVVIAFYPNFPHPNNVVSTIVFVPTKEKAIKEQVKGQALHDVKLNKLAHTPLFHRYKIRLLYFNEKSLLVMVLCIL